MRLRYILLALLALFGSPKPLTYAQKILAEVSGLASPESVLRVGDFLYVSNVGTKLAPMEADGDGFISRLSLAGKVLERQAFKGLNAPKGMAQLGNVLYVTDIDRIVGLDMGTRKVVLELKPGGAARFLNDLVAVSDSILYASATDVHKLYRINIRLRTIREEPVADLPPGPNGLCLDPAKNLLYLVTYNNNEGMVARIDLSQQPLRAVRTGSSQGALDGLVLDRGALLVSDWGGGEGQGRLFRLRPDADVPSLERATLISAADAATEQVLPIGQPLSGPADFYLDPESRKLYLPCMMAGKLLILQL